jgi:hypothetical protein
MRRPRITIAALLGIVALVGVAVAALREPTDGWDSGVLGVTLMTLLTSVLLAVQRMEERRSFWLGFALFGWAYLVASLVPPVEARLPTTKFLAHLDPLFGERPWINTLSQFIDQQNPSWARPDTSTVAFLPQGDISMGTKQGLVFLGTAPNGSPLALRGGTSQKFIRIGHLLLALILALVGGSLSRGLFSSARPGRDAEPDKPRPSHTESVDA